jgi:rhodanese-related sulfurtransferase
VRLLDDAIEQLVHGIFERLQPSNDEEGLFTEVEEQIKAFVLDVRTVERWEAQGLLGADVVPGRVM